MASGNQIKFGVGYQVDKASVQKVKQSLRQLQNIKPTSFKGTEQELIKIKDTAKVVQQALRQAFNPSLNTTNLQTFEKVLQQNERSLQSVYTQFSRLGPVGKQAFSNLASQVMTTNVQLTQTKTLLTTMGQTMMNTVKWGIASSVMNTFTNSVRQAFEYVKNLDSALTDIRIVTGDSTQKMAQFAEQANKAAQSLGRSTMDYSKAALTFYQQGLSDEDVAARTQSTLVAQNITGAGQEMADYLTAVWNGYKVANEEAELYVDKLAAVADSSASNMSQLAVAMSKVASTANMLGVPIDSLNAQIATIVATTRQAPESVGNALKTIYARINDIATGADDAQISLGNYSSKMAEVGISVLDASGRLRDTGDVIDEVGQKWNTLSREQQIYLARTMAGQRQYNNLLALFENWGRYTDLVNVSMDAQGASMEKNSRYMESLAAKMEQFGAAGERVKAALVNQDDLKGITDFGTKTINLFASLIEGIGGGGKALATFGSIFVSLFSNVISKQISNTIIKSNQLKASAESMQSAIQGTEKISQILNNDPFLKSNDSLKQYVNNLQQIQKYWSVMSKEDIELYQSQAKKVDTYSREVETWNQNSKALQNYLKTLNRYKDINIDLQKSTPTKGMVASMQDLEKEIDNIEQTFSKFSSGIDRNLGNLNAGNFKTLKTEVTELANKFGIQLPQSINISWKTFDKSMKGNIAEAEDFSNGITYLIDKFKQLLGFGTNIDQNRQKIEEARLTLQKAGYTVEKIKTNAQIAFDTKAVVGFVNGLSRIAMGISSIMNLYRTLTNESLSVGEKITQTITTILFLLPSMGTAFSAVIKNFKGTSESIKELARRIIEGKAGTVAANQAEAASEMQVAGAAGSAAVAQTGVAVANEVEGASAGVATGANMSLAGSLLTIVAAAAPFIAIGAAIAGVIYAIVKEYNKAKNAAQQATKRMQSANETYKEVKGTYDDLKTSLDSLHSAYDNLKDLTTGTEQWRSALEDVNGQVLQLLEKFPQLASYVTTSRNGVLEISEAGQQYILDEQRKATQATALSYVATRQASDEATRTSKITDLGRDILGLGNFDVFEKLITAIQEEGQSVLVNNDYLKNTIGLTETQIDAIKSHITEINALASQLKANTIATEALSTSMVGGTVLDPEILAKSSNPQMLTSIVNNLLKNAGQTGKFFSSYGTPIDVNNFTNIPGASKTALESIRTEIAKDQQAIAQYYGEIIGKQVQWTGAKYRELDAQTGEWKDLDTQVVEYTANYQKALEDLPNYIKQAEQKIKEYSTEYGESLGDVIYHLENDKVFDTSKASYNDLSEILNNDDYIEATGKTQQQLKDIQREIVLNILDYINTLPTEIKNHLRDSGLEDTLSEEEIRVVGNTLKEAWNKGVYDQIASALDDIQPKNQDDLINFINSLDLDLENLNIKDFRKSLEEAGLSCNETDIELQNLIRAVYGLKDAAGDTTAQLSAEDRYASIQDGIGDFFEKLAKDSEARLSKKNYQSLTQLGLNLDGFFEQTYDGTYKLLTSAKEFYDYIRTQQAKGFEERQTNLENSRRIYNNTANYQTNRESTDVSTLQDQVAQFDIYATRTAVNFLKQQGQSSEYLDKALEKIRSHSQDAGEYIRYIRDLLLQYKDIYENIPEKIEEINSQLEHTIEEQEQANFATEKNRQAIRQLQLDADVQADAWKNMTAYIKQAAQGIQDFNGDGLDDLSDSLMTDSEAAEDLSQQILRFSAAAEQAADKYDTWKEQLNSTDWGQQIAAGEQLQNVYSDILGLPFDTLSAGFAQDAENLQYLETVLWGDEEAAQAAYNQLAFLAEQDYETRFGISDESLAQFDTDLNTIRSTIANGIDDLAVGAYIDDANVYQQMNALINAADMTAQEASDLLASMGVDAEIEEVKTNADDVTQLVNATPQIEWEEVEIPNIYGSMFSRTALTHKMNIPKLNYNTDKIEEHSDKSATATALRVKSARKSSGGNIGVKRQNIPAKKGTSGTGSSSPKGSSSTPKAPKIEKHSAEKIDIKEKQTFVNPYEQIEKSYERQEDLLKDLSDLQGNLVGKDRLDNLKKQNEQLKKQNKTIQQRQKLSEDAGVEGTTAWYKKQLQNDDALKGVVKFDEDGQINETASKNAAVNAYNATAKQIQADFDKVQDDYNTWLDNVWNKYSGEQQEANKAEKEKRDQDLKEAKTKAQEEIKLADEVYNKRIKNIDQYQKALEEDLKFHEQYIENLEKQIENQIQRSKIKVDLSLDFGQLQRDFLDFNNKVIKKLSKDDILGNAKSNIDNIMSYFNSKELTGLQNQISKITKQINIIQSGGFSSLYGLSRSEYDELSDDQRQALRIKYLKQAQEDLEKYTKQYMDSLENIEDLHQEIRELYLDSIDDAKDKLDQVIEQYERINDLVQHNVKLTQLLYGDNAGFDILDKYYARQEENNLDTLKTLDNQKRYWERMMNNAEVGSDEWKKFKANYEDVVDKENSLLEQQLELIATKFENRMTQAIKNVQNNLTNNLGSDYLDRQWDYMKRDDDSFLDAVNSKFGIEEVERLYAAAANEAGAPAQQQKINKLMQDQLKLLREKDRLTQYDIDRAKAALQVEKARMALEDARYNKTKMRLRRDSQGNYTYQYVADEEKLTDLQSALASAQNELYNMDKEHYQQQLAEMNNAYKEYLEEYNELTALAAQTRDKAEKERILKQRELLTNDFQKWIDDINNDANFTFSVYLPESTSDSLGVDISQLTSEETRKFLENTVPGVNTQVARLSQNLIKQGGILEATAQYYKELDDAVQELTAAQDKALKAAGTSVDQVSSAEDDKAIQNTEKYIDNYKKWGTEAKNVVNEMKTLLAQIDKFLNLKIDNNPFLGALQSVYETLQNINSLDGSTGARIINYMDPYQTSDQVLNKYLKNNSNKNLDSEKLQGYSQDYNASLLAYNTAKSNANSLKSEINSAIKAARESGVQITEEQRRQWENRMNESLSIMDRAANNISSIHDITAQDVTIRAEFPNVENSNEIRDALETLIGKASQAASSTTKKNK